MRTSRLALSILVTALGCADESLAPGDAGHDAEADAHAGRAEATAELDAAAGPDACLPLPCPQNAPWNAASCSCQPTCELEAEVDKRSSGIDVHDCGTLTRDASAAQLAEAQMCVLSAMRSRSSFKLIHWQQGTDSAVAEAYASPGDSPSRAGLRSILHYDSDPSGGNGVGASLGEQTCADLQPDPDCNSAEGVCLRCVGQVESSIACSARVVARDQCRGPGNYQAGKEGSYQPCCAGLREVFQQSAAQVDGIASCVDALLRVYACVEGSCGDDHCEDAEAVPCGCEQDCPTAVVAP